MSLGKFKFRFQRVTTYLSTPLGIMAFISILRTNGVRWYWIIGGLTLGCYLLDWFDQKYVIDDEGEVTRDFLLKERRK